MAVVERFKQEVMYGLSSGTKKGGRCREVAVVERWPLVEVRLYFNSISLVVTRGHQWSLVVTGGYSWSLMSPFRPYQGGDILKIEIICYLRTFKIT